jgi:hypothetical protein
MNRLGQLARSLSQQEGRYPETEWELYLAP